MIPVRIINIVLVIAAIVLVINLISPINIITGNLIYGLDNSESQCYFNNSDNLHRVPIDRCCYEIQKQLICRSIDSIGEFDLKCYTSETSGRYYLVNHKAFNYCKIEGYDVKVE